MKIARTLILGISALVAVQALAQSPREIIQGNYDKISQLSLKKDAKALERVAKMNASSSFEYIDGMRNSMDLGVTVRQNSENLSRVYKFNSASNKIIGMKERGPDLVCTVKTSFDVFLDASGKNRVVGTSVSEDTWIKTLTGWKLRKTKVMKESTSRNGKPLK